MGQPLYPSTAALLLACAFACCAAQASPRFRLQGELEALPAAKGDTRFTLRAALQPAARHPNPAAQRFLLSARLEADTHKAACVREERIFGNGFEQP